MQQPISVQGEAWTLSDVVAIAEGGTPVHVPEEKMARVKQGFYLLLLAAEKGIPIYGLNTGVGANKDRKLLDAWELNDDTRALSIDFNKRLLRSHAAGMAPYAPIPIVRAAMAIRLNTMVNGSAGIQPEAIQLLVEMLNRGITPRVPSIGSIGQADITILSHIGLAMIGEWQVDYQGTTHDADKLFAQLGIQPLIPFAKDALALLSANAFSAACAVMALQKARHVLQTADTVYAMSLEALNGNVAPLHPQVVALRQNNAAPTATDRIRSFLAGSYLNQPHPERALQDPLSFRVAPEVHDLAHEALHEAIQKLTAQINSSDDNPSVILDPEGANAGTDDRSYVQNDTISGWVLPTANFLPLAWVLRLEALGNAVGHLSRLSANRTLRLSDPEITKLPRFLSRHDVIGIFAPIQKLTVALDAEVTAHAAPVSLNFLAVAKDIEDHATNAPLVIDRLNTQLDTFMQVLTVELIHIMQALHLRKAQSEMSLGRITEPMYHHFASIIPPLDSLSPLTPTLERTLTELKNGALATP